MTRRAAEVGHGFRFRQEHARRGNCFVSYSSAADYARDVLSTRTNASPPLHDHEIIAGDCPVVPYIDVDWADPPAGTSPDAVLAAVRAFYVRVWNETYPSATIDDTAFLVATSTDPSGSKLSWHILVRPTDGDVLFPANAQQQSFVRTLKQRMGEPRTTEERRWSDLTNAGAVIDGGVYGRDRSLRTIGSVKLCDRGRRGRVKRPADEGVARPLEWYLVSYQRPDPTQLPVSFAAAARPPRSFGTAGGGDARLGVGVVQFVLRCVRQKLPSVVVDDYSCASPVNSGGDIDFHFSRDFLDGCCPDADHGNTYVGFKCTLNVFSRELSLRCLGCRYRRGQHIGTVPADVALPPPPPPPPPAGAQGVLHLPNADAFDPEAFWRDLRLTSSPELYANLPTGLYSRRWCPHTPFDDGHSTMDTLLVRGFMSTGKTRLVENLVRDVGPDATVLVVSCNTSLAVALHARIGGDLYVTSDRKVRHPELKDFRRPIVQLDSLWLLGCRPTPWDLVVLDESETLFSRCTSAQLARPRSTWYQLIKYLRKARRVVVLDAYLSSRTCEVIAHCRDPARCRVLVNTYARDNRTYYDVSDPVEWEKRMYDAVEAGKNIFVAANSKALAKRVDAELRRRFPDRVQVLCTADTPDREKMAMYRDPNGAFERATVVVVSPCLPVGVDCTLDTFDVMFLYACNRSSVAREVHQLSYRLRALRDEAVYVCVEHFGGDSNARLPTTRAGCLRSIAENYDVIERVMDGYEFNWQRSLHQPVYPEEVKDRDGRMREVWRLQGGTPDAYTALLIENTVERHRSLLAFRREFRALVMSYGARYVYLPNHLAKEATARRKRDLREQARERSDQRCRDVCAAEPCDHSRSTIALSYLEQCQDEKYRLCTAYSLSDVTEPAFVRRFARAGPQAGFRAFVAAISDDEYTFARWWRERTDAFHVHHRATFHDVRDINTVLGHVGLVHPCRPVLSEEEFPTASAWRRGPVPPWFRACPEEVERVARRLRVAPPPSSTPSLKDVVDFVKRCLRAVFGGLLRLRRRQHRVDGARVCSWRIHSDDRRTLLQLASLSRLAPPQVPLAVCTSVRALLAARTDVPSTPAARMVASQYAEAAAPARFLLQVLTVDVTADSRVRIFGRTPAGEAVTVLCGRQPAYFYVRPTARSFMHHLRHRGVRVKAVTSVQRTSVRGYRGTETFHRVELQRPSDLRTVRRLLGGGGCGELFEADCGPVTRFLVDRGVVGCGWIEVDAGDRPRGQQQQPVSARHINVDVSGTPDTADDVARWTVMAYEVVVRGDNGALEEVGLVVAQPHGVTLVHLHVGEARHPPPAAAAPPYRSVSCADSAVLARQWQAVVAETDPDILVGYRSRRYDGFPRLGRVAEAGTPMREDWRRRHEFAPGRVVVDLYDDVLQPTARDHRLEVVVAAALPSVSSAGRCFPPCLRRAWFIHRLARHERIVANAVAETRVTGTLLDVVWSRKPTTFENNTLLLRHARRKHFLVGPTPSSGRSAKVKTSGGLHLPPVTGFHETPVAVLDFRSHYPSIMCRYNYSMDTENLRGGVVPDGTFVPRSTRVGLLPSIVNELLAARRDAKRAMQSLDPSDPVYKALDQRQRALKRRANTIYGHTLAPHCAVPCRNVGASVASMGRALLKRAKGFVERRCGARVVGGNTDSLMVTFADAHDVATCAARARACVARMTEEALFGAPVTMEFERVLYPLLILDKSKRCGRSYGQTGARAPELYTRGMALDRRGTCDAVRACQRDVLERLMVAPATAREAVRGEVLASVGRVLASVVNGTVGVERLAQSNELKRVPPAPQSTAPVHRAYRRLCHRGRAGGLAVGDRVRYVFVEGGADGVADPGEEPAKEVAGGHYLTKVFKGALGPILDHAFGPGASAALFVRPRKRPREGPRDGPPLPSLGGLRDEGGVGGVGVGVGGVGGVGGAKRRRRR